MTAYATVGALRAMSDMMADDLCFGCTDEQLSAVLERSSTDLDGWLCIPIPGPDSAAVPPCRIDVEADLSTWESWVLGTAVVYQSLYRLARGEVDLLEGPADLISAAGVTFASQAPPLVGGMVELALSGATSLQRFRSGCALPDPEPSFDDARSA